MQTCFFKIAISLAVVALQLSYMPKYFDFIKLYLKFSSHITEKVYVFITNSNRLILYGPSRPVTGIPLPYFTSLEPESKVVLPMENEGQETPS
jgi:hypothetical protein